MTKSDFYKLGWKSIPVWLIVGSISFSCGRSDSEMTYPKYESLTESVYASGLVKAVDQYEAYLLANGPIQEIFVAEGDTIQVGTPILQVYNEAEKLRRENAQLAQTYADQQANQTRLRDLELSIQLAKSKLTNDSLLYARTKNLWNQRIGTEVDLEQKELNFKNSKTAYESALLKYSDLKREIAYNSSSARKNLRISEVMESDYVLRSKLNGIVYSLPKKIGEMVTPQIPLAIIGRSGDFILEMQVDEYDIAKVKEGQKIKVTMDSFKEQVFEGTVTKIYPIMDSKSKTFKVEAVFTKAPERLFPNLTLEANILTQVKEKTLIIPRNFLLGDDKVITSAGDTLQVKVGIKTFQYAEILEGVTESTELTTPIL